MCTLSAGVMCLVGSDSCVYICPSRSEVQSCREGEGGGGQGHGQGKGHGQGEGQGERRRERWRDEAPVRAEALINASHATATKQLGGCMCRFSA